jgi:hypothetical protein
MPRPTSHRVPPLELTEMAQGTLMVQAQVRAVLVSLCMLGLMSLNFTLWRDYAGMALWAFVLSEALSRGREQYMAAMEEMAETVRSGRGVVHWLLMSAHMAPIARIWMRAKFGLQDFVPEGDATEAASPVASRRRSAGKLSRANSCPDVQRGGDSASRRRHKPARQPSHSPAARRSTGGHSLLSPSFWQSLLGAVSAELAQQHGQLADFLAHECEGSVWKLVQRSACVVWGVVPGAIGMVVDYGLLAFCCYAALHRTSLHAFLGTSVVAALALCLLLWSLQMTGFLVHLIESLAVREVYSILVIFGTIFCIVGVCLFLIIGALYDLGSGSVGIYTYIAEKSRMDNDTMVSLYHNGTALLQVGYSRMEGNYASEEWWSVVAVRRPLRPCRLPF